MSGVKPRRGVLAPRAGVAVPRGHRPGVPIAVWTTAAYVFLVTSRLPELLPTAHLVVIVALVAVGASLTLRAASLSFLLGRAETHALLGLWCLAALSIPTSYWPGQSAMFLIDFTKIVMTFLLIAYSVRSHEDADLVVAALIVAALVLEIQFVVFAGEGESVTATYDRNDLAFVLSVLIPLAAVAAPARFGMRYIGIAVGVLGCAVIVSTLSRGGFITLLVAGAFIVLRTRSRRFFVVIAIVAVLLLVFGVIASDRYWARMETIWGVGAADEADYDAQGFDVRWRLWKRGATMMLQHPLLGVGAGVFPIAEGVTRGTPGPWWAAHNAYLQVGAELGVVGLILFLRFLYCGLRNTRSVTESVASPNGSQRAWRLSRGLEAALGTFLIGALALSQGYAYLLYILVALTVVVTRISAEGKAQS